MGVEFDRILDGFDGPFEKIDDVLAPPKGQISGKGGSGFLLSHEVNDAFIAVNRLVAGDEEVYWLKNAFTIEEQQPIPPAPSTSGRKDRRGEQATESWPMSSA